MNSPNNGDWIKIHRKIGNWGWRRSPNHLSVFIDLLVNAQWQESEYRGLKLRPGMLSTSIHAISTRTGVSFQSVRTVLRDLISTREITIKSTSKCSIISITKWDEYQCANKQVNNQLTIIQQTSNNLQEGKNKRTKEYIYTPLIKEIIDYLNLSIGTEYTYSSKLTTKHITARLKEGYKLDDFKRVIDAKSKEWRHNPEYSDYLRPQTLFSPKFESYLQNAKRGNFGSLEADEGAFAKMIIRDGGKQ